MQRFAGHDIKNTKIEEIPSRAQIVEADNPEPTRFNGGMQSWRTFSHNSTPAAEYMSMMEIDYGGVGASQPYDQTTPGEVTLYDKFNSVILRLLMDHEVLYTSQILATIALEDHGKQRHASQR